MLVAVISHEDGTIAPVDDSGRHFDAVNLYEVDKSGPQRAAFPFDPKARDFDLRTALVVTNVTDVIAQHYEPECFTKLKTAGLHLWLEAPGFTPREAMNALADGELPEAVVGARAVHGPEGRVVHHEERDKPLPVYPMAHGSNPVITPMRGGKSLI
jgi:hypothetical protein